jgi:hypothetical protein
VQVVRAKPGRNREQPLEVLDAVSERGQCLGVLKVTDVMTDPSATALGDADGVLQLRSTGEHRRLALDRQFDAFGNVAARAPQRERTGSWLRPVRALREVRELDHRIVGAGLDRPVVDQK